MISIISSNSFSLSTLPVGLLGEFIIINFVFEDIFSLSCSTSILKPFFGEVSRKIGLPPASFTI